MTYLICTAISGAMFMLIMSAPDSFFSLKDVIDIVPTENSLAQNTIDMLSAAGIDPKDTSSEVVLKSASKPIDGILVGKEYNGYSTDQSFRQVGEQQQ